MSLKFRADEGRINLWITLIAVSLPFSLKINTYLIFILALDVLLFCFDYKKFSLKKFLIFSGYYLLMIVGILHSYNIKNAFYTLEIQASLAVFPILFFGLSRKIRIDTNQVLLFFVISVSIADLYCFVESARWHFREVGNLFPIRQIYFTNLELSHHLGIHPTYISMYNAFALTITLEYLRKWGTGITKYGSMAISFYLLFFIGSFASKAIYIYVLFLMIYIFFYKANLHFKLFLFASILVTGIILYPNISKRLDSLTLSINAAKQETEEWGSMNLRVMHWTCSIDLIAKHWFLGVGTGDDREELSKCYNEKFSISEFSGYDSHNQFLQAWLKGGMFAMLAILLSLVYAGHMAIINNDKLYISFILLVGIVAMTECILHAQKGVVLYALFNMLFFRANAQNNSHNEL